MTDVRRAAPERRGGHLYEIDVLRVLTFACVIAVHVIDHTIEPDDRALFVALGLFHFTREVFFALTAFVLVYSYDRRPQPFRRFLPRRFLLVGVPYLVWSAIYQAYADLTGPARSPLEVAGRYLVAVLEGTGGYHLYFLLVTLQVYILFPLLILLVRRTRGHHVALLVVAAAVQLLVLGAWQYVPGLKDGLGNIPNATFVSYVFMVVGGAVAADHADAFLPWLRRRGRTVGVLVAAAAVLTVGTFVVHMAAGMHPGGSVTALQPVILVWASATGIGFLVLGARYADTRTPGGRLDRALATASDVSFGVFLVHPLVIYVAIKLARGPIFALPDFARQAVLYVLVVVVSLGFAWLVRRTPLSLPLAGRPRARARRPEPAPARG